MSRCFFSFLSTLRFLLEDRLDVNHHFAAILAAGEACPVPQVRTAALWTLGKPHLVESVVSPSIVPV